MYWSGRFPNPAKEYRIPNITLGIDGSGSLLFTPSTTTDFTAGVWTGDVTVQEAANDAKLSADDGAGHTGESNTFDMVTPNFTVTLPADSTEGATGVTGTVSLPVTPASDVTVTLSSSDTGELDVPASVTIAGGSSSAAFALTLVDDALLDGDQPVTVTASAAGFVDGTGSMIVGDDETATITLTAASTSVNENDGSLSFTLDLDAAPDEDAMILLTSSDDTVLSVPANVTVLSGQTSASFTATIPDDDYIDGDETIDITASVLNWTSDTETIDVLDNENTLLTVSVPAVQREGDGLLSGAGTVSLSGKLTSDLTITLASDDASELTLPATSVTIPAESTSVTFDIQIETDATTDGAQTVTVTASATGFTDGTASCSVKDIDMHHFDIDPGTNAKYAGIPFALSVTAQNIDNEVLDFYSGAVTLSAAGDGGAKTVDTTGITLASGTWTGVVQIAEIDTNIVVTADDGTISGTSAAFDVLDPTGEIRGTVWNDLNRDGVFDTGEPGLSSWTVYIDANANGVLDTGETSTTSDISGDYTFSVQPGAYTIAQEVQPLWNQTNSTNAFTGDVNFITHYRDGINTVDGLDDAHATTVSPDGNHVYAVSRRDVCWFSRDASTGELTWQGVLKDNINGVDGLDDPRDVTVSPDGSHVYVASNSDRAVSIFSRDASTGSLTYVGMVRDNSNGVDGLYSCNSVTLSPDGLFLYASGQYDDAVAVFSRDASTGELTFLQVVKDGVNGVDGLYGASKVTVSPDSAHLYVASYQDGVAVFSRDATTGLLTYVQKFVHSDLDYCNSVTVSPDGAHVYAAAVDNDYVYVFDRNTTTGELTFVESYRQGVNGIDGLDAALDVNISPDGMTVTVTSYGSDALAVFDRNPTDGRLTQRTVLKDGVNGVDGLGYARYHSYSPDGRHIYTAGYDDDSVAVFERMTIDESHVVTVAPAAIVEDIDFGNKEQALFITAAGSLTEGDATASVTVDLAFPTASGLDVTLVSDTPGEITVATATVTIPAGSATATFSIDAVDDTATDGTQSVILTASVAGLTDATHTIDVVDNDFDHFAFDTIASPQTGDVRFNAVLRAVTVDGSPAPPYAGTVTLTAAGDAATPSVTPGSVTLSNGTWSGNLALTGLDTNVILTADDGSATGTSNAFDVTYGAFDHFTWDTITSPKYIDYPFATTVTAKDANGYTVENFAGTVTLNATKRIGDSVITIKNDEEDILWHLPFPVSYKYTRTQVIYLASELGRSRTLSSLALNVAYIKQEDFRNWTIRMKHTSKSNFNAAPSWESEWTTVHQSTASLSSLGWNVFTFDSPFVYNGTDNLIVDFSYVNNFFTDGYNLVNSMRTFDCRSICRYSNSSLDTKPLTWTGTNPAPRLETEIPDIQFNTARELLLISPNSSTDFTAGVWTGDVTVQEAASDAKLSADDGAGHAGESNTFDVVIPNFTVTLPADGTEGASGLTGTVSLPVTPASDVTVTLSSSDTGELDVPASVTITGGSSSAAFALTLVDDAILDGNQPVTVTASAAGFVDGAGSMIVGDDETATITLTTASTSVNENDGSLSFTLDLDAAPDEDATVVLTSSDDTVLSVPASVTILSGQTSATFTGDIHDNDFIGNAAVDITASMLNWTAGTETIDVLDNENTLLTVSVPAVQWESNGLLSGAGTVSLSGKLTSDLTVTLASDDTSELTLPATSVTIPAESTSVTSVTFDIQIETDATTDGAQTVTVTASATGFTDGTASCSVKDSDMHNFGVDPGTNAKYADIPFALTVTAQNIDNELLDFYSGVVTLSATGDGGAKTLDTTGITLASGTWTGDVQIAEFDTGVTITADDSIITSNSSAFDLLDGTGEIRGTVWNDLNRDGVFDTGEPGLSSWTVYIDANDNGVLDAGETSTTSDTSGDYSFSIQPGVYTIVQSNQSYWNQTSPSAVFTGDVHFVNHYRDGVNGIDGLGGAFATAVSPDGVHVYAVGDYDSAICWFTRNVYTGELVWQSFLKDGVDRVDGLSRPKDVTVSPDGRHVYVASYYDAAVSIFSRDSSTGSLNYVGMIQNGINGVDGILHCSSVELSPNGSYLYTSGEDGNATAVFNRNVSTGELSFIQVNKHGVSELPDAVTKVALSPDGSHLYSAAYCYISSILRDVVSSYNCNSSTGRLSLIERTDFGVIKCDYLSMSPDGNHLYAIAYSHDTFYLFHRYSPTGELSYLKRFASDMRNITGIRQPKSIVISPDGLTATVASYANSALAVFDRNPVDGDLSQRSLLKDDENGIDGLDGINRHSYSPDGKHIYTAAQGDDSVAVFERTTICKQEVTVNPAEHVESIDFGNYSDAGTPWNVDLLAVSDTGVSNQDNITNLRQGLSFSVSGCIPGSLIKLYYENGTRLAGSATAADGTVTITTKVDESADFSNGTHSITATMTEPGKAESLHSPALTIIVDSAGTTATAATTISTKRFTANWQALSEASKYYLYVSSTSTFTSCVPGYENLEVMGTTCEVKGLQPNTTYFYRIRAYKPAGLSDYSNKISVTTHEMVTASVPGEYSTLGDALAAAGEGTLILLGEGTLLENNLIVSQNDVIIQGISADVTLVDGENFGRVFTITGDNVLFQNIGIVNGDAGTENGGGILVESGSLMMDYCEVSNCSAANGAGIANNSELILNGCTITGSSATANGAGIYNEANATASLINSTVSGNTGTGIYSSGILAIDSSTITDNTDGIHITVDGSLDYTNTILAGNTNQNLIDDGGSVINSGNNLLDTDPVLQSLVRADNGVRVHLPGIGSPTLNAGSSSQTIDQRGLPRPAGSNADIGAVELRYYSVELTAGNNGVLEADGTQQATFSFNIPETHSSATVTAVESSYATFSKWVLAGNDFSTDNPLTVTNVTETMSLTAVYSLVENTVSFSAGENGSLDGDLIQSVSYMNDTTPVIATPNEGYHFVKWMKGGVDFSTDNPLVITEVTETVELTAEFAINQYTVTYTAGPDGSVNGVTSQLVNHGETTSEVKADPALHYHFVEWQSDGSSFSTDNPLIIAEVDRNIVLTAVFAIDRHPISITSNAGGTVSPAGDQIVDGGSDLTIEITPLSGNRIADVIVDGVSYGSKTSWIFNEISSTHTVEVLFKPLRFYVDAEHGTDEANGWSWQTALVDLQAAIEAAKAVGGADIWVKKGVYTPRARPNGGDTYSDKTVHFGLYSNVRIYGGFAGTETSLEQRDLYSNKTIISGDILGDDRWSNSRPVFSNGEFSEPDRDCETDRSTTFDNSYHVFYMPNEISHSLLDGIFITGGIADADGGDDIHGGGIYSAGGLKLKNCIFIGNFAITNGGAIYQKYSSVSVENCAFWNNKAGLQGGAMALPSCKLNANNNTFAWNKAGRGGAVFFHHGNMNNCTAFGNRAGQGAFLHHFGSVPAYILNTVVWDNDGIDITSGNIEALHIYSSFLEETFQGNQTDIMYGNPGLSPPFFPLFCVPAHSESPILEHGWDVYYDDTEEMFFETPEGEFYYTDNTNANPDSAAGEYTASDFRGVIRSDKFTLGAVEVGASEITYAPTENGIYITEPETVSDFSSISLLCEPDYHVGYEFVGWTWTPSAHADVADPGYHDTTAIVAGDVEFKATFQLCEPTVEFQTDGTIGASISGDTLQTVSYGTSLTEVTAVSPPNYAFVGWFLHGDIPFSSANALTIEKPSQDMVLTAVFAIEAYSVTFTAGANGSLTGDVSQTISHGSEATAVEAVPAAGYHFTQWSDGNTDNPRTITDVTGPVSLTAGFAINTYSVSFSAGSNGSLTGDLLQTVSHGNDSSAVTVVPGTGYQFAQWGDGNTSNPRTVSNVISPVSLTAEFAINTYSVSFTAGIDGSLNGDLSQTISHGSEATAVESVPAAGFHFTQWSDGNTENPRTVTNVTGPVSVTAEFAINTYSVSFVAGSNGSLTGELSQTVSHGGSSSAVTAVPVGGYHFVQWSDGNTDNPRTFSNVTGPVSLTAEFAINMYSVSFAAGANGSLNGDASQTIDHGSDATAVEAVPSTGYHFTQWNDGNTDNTRTLTDVTGPVSVTAEFAINTYAVSFVAGSNGTLTGELSQAVSHGGGSSAVTAVPVGGYHFVQWSDGNTDNPRTFSNVTGPVSLTAEFAINTYSVSFAVGANGSLNGDASQTIDHGSDSTAVEAVPATGYHFTQWNDGNTDNPRKLTDVTGPVSLTAEFAINTYSVSFAAGSNGSLTGELSQTVSHGSDSSMVTAEPDVGYHFAQWSDGNSDNPRTVSNITAPVYLTAEFAINTYSVSFAVGANGSLNGDASQTIDHGSDSTAVEAVPATGYHFTQWNDGNTDNPRTVTNVTGPVSVTAEFALNRYTVSGNVSWDFVGLKDVAFDEVLTDEFGDFSFTVTHGESIVLEPVLEGYTFTPASVSLETITENQTDLSFVAKKNQTIDFTVIADCIVTDTVTLAASASSGLDVRFELVSGPASLAGSELTFTEIGSVTVKAVQDGEANWNPASAEQSFLIGQGQATVTLSNLTQTYDGTPKEVSVTTSPDGLETTVEYNVGSTPVDAGSYEVVAFISGGAYIGSTSGTLVIEKAAPEISSWPDPISMNWGTNLTNSMLIGGTANVNGYFEIQNPETVKDVSDHTVTTKFIPEDGSNYNTVSNTITVSVAAVIPEIKTAALTEITANSAVCGGVVASSGGISITGTGLCWGTDSEPDFDAFTLESGADSFTATMEGLEPDTTYYVWAYAMNSAGVGYGDARIFTSSVGSQTLELGIGWNLVSLPLVPDETNDTVSELFGDNSNVWEWNAATASYRQPTDLATGKGYWIYLQAPANIEVSGTVPAETQLSLSNAGWHLVGPFSDCTAPANTEILGNIWGWDLTAYFDIAETSGTPVWHVPGKLISEHGYWIYLSSPCTVTVGE